MEQLERYAQRCEREDRRIAQLPAVGAGSRRELRSHAETRALVVSPPAGETRPLRLRMAFVDEAPGHGAGSGIEVFVAAPDREIGAARVQIDRQIADRVCQ